MVCVRVPDAVTGAPAELIANHGTTTPDLLELVDWLRGLGVTDVAMESTGVYWKPIYYLLEDDFTVLLVNAAHIKHVPGRKTDTIDAAWIAQLLAHGLLTASFVPPPPVRELRDLTRYRKVLQDSGIKLTTYATDGVSRIVSCALLRAAGLDSLWSNDIDRDLHRRYYSPVLEPVGRVPVLRPTHPRPILRRDPVSMVGDHSLQDVHRAWSALVVVDRAEDASGLDGHHPHSKLVPFHTLDLAGKFDRCQHLHRDTLRLSRCHLLVAHCALPSIPRDPPRTAASTPAGSAS